MPDQPGDLLTLQEAAEHLKVHYMTAYRWVRRGDLAAFKAGGRLRVRRADVEGFVLQRRVDVVQPHEGRTDWPTHIDRLCELLAGGRGADAAHLVRKVIADGAPCGQVYLDLLTPALHRIGDAWEAGTLTVAEEHRASEIVAAILARLSDTFRRRGPSRGTAVTLTPPGEQHGIAAAMAADFLRAAGFDVHHLGVNVPLDDLRRFVTVLECDVLCVSVTARPADDALYSHYVATLAGTGRGTTAFGGQGADPDAVTAAGGIFVESLRDLVADVEQAGVVPA